MNQSSDESRIREMVQRLKSRDDEHAPSFDDVLGRRHGRPARLQLTIACCTVAMLLVALLFIRMQQHDPVVQSGMGAAEDIAPAMPDTERQDERVVEIDFAHLHRVIEEHFSDIETAKGAWVSVWSGDTEPLLAVNLAVPLEQE